MAFRINSQHVLCFALTALVLVLQNPQAYATTPASNNYVLRNHAWGGGGTGGSDSNTYSMFGLLGELGDATLSSENYRSLPGLAYTIMANVPPAPVLTNDTNYYNRLQIVINEGDNPSDAAYAIAVSPDNFTTTYYLSADGTLTENLTHAEFQTYAAWGGAIGTTISDLQPNTTYTAKVSARHGSFTQSPFGPSSTAATESLNVSFDIDVHATDSETSPPYELNLNELSPGQVTSGSESIWLDISTNAVGGATIYVEGAEGGLTSSSTGYTIQSISDDLDSQSEGVGLQSIVATQSEGGPLVAIAPYNGANNTVGSIPLQLESIFSSGAAITNGRASFVVKAKTNELTPAAPDYSETLTVVAAPIF